MCKCTSRISLVEVVIVALLGIMVKTQVDMHFVHLFYHHTISVQVFVQWSKFRVSNQLICRTIWPSTFICCLIKEF